MLSDTFCVKDLDYGGEKARRDSRQRAYIILAVAAAVIVYMMMQPANASQPVMKRAKKLMSMVASSVASAKYAHQVYDNVQAQSMIILIRDSAQRSATPEAKEAKKKQFEEWQTSTESGLVMIYSDSCGHCHNAMPAFSKATLNPKINAVMLSGDSLPMEYARDTLNLQYFPTFMVWKNGSLTQVADIQTGVAELSEVVDTDDAGSDVDPLAMF